MNIWQRKSLITWLLAPFSALFWLISTIRRGLYRLGWLKSYRSPVPVLVVGNLSVGGNGKTPVVVWLVEQLQQLGLNVGVISRGYGGKCRDFPQLVTAESSAEMMGDEPVLIVQRTNVPLAISPNRQQSIELLLNTAESELDLIISDDGLQHYALERDYEWIVIDGERRFGNGFLLPAGGLRELPSRLKQADSIICNGGQPKAGEHLMTLKPSMAINLLTKEQRALAEFKQAVAIAGIGHPPRFFTMLEALGIQLLKCQGFADHQAFQKEALSALAKEDTPLLMTEKDAVKCQAFAQENWWYVPVTATFSQESTNSLSIKLALKLKLAQEQKKAKS